MKEGRIKIIIGLMTLALLGLVGFQYYLIQNLVKVEEERFDRSVSEALNSVVMQIDRKEALNAVQNEMINQIDTIMHPGGMTIKKITRDSSVNVEQVIENRTGFQFITKSDSIFPKSLIMVGENESGLTKEEIFIDTNQDTIFVSKFNLVTEVVTELLSTKMDLETRLSFLPLDSLLSQELADRGIELSHSFGVIDKDKTPIILSKGSDSLKVVNSNYSVRLFPLDLTGKQNQLKVYFADTSSYILGNIAWMLGLSGLFLFVIGIIFFTTIRMLLHQKKIAEVKNDLINNITHEFKTPLSTISIASEALADPSFSKEDSVIKKYTQMISAENKRLTTMVESLLNAAAFESGSYKLSLENVSLHLMIAKVLEDNDEFLKSVSAKISTRLDAQMDTIKIDEFHFANVIKNLLENAAKYNEAEPKIEISTYNENSHVFIEIKDNGIGISKEHQKRIFDTFYRVPTGNVHNVKGNGIGLSYVYKMISAHKGTVSLKSKVGVGSTFIIKLPVIENE
jgi:two-component system phosphate regulon sensor histidine kinase PhoR